MAQRDFDPDVPTTDVTPLNASTNLMLGLSEVGAKAAEASEQSKLLMYGAQAHAAFKGLDAQYRMKFADSPGSPEATDWLTEQRKQVSDSLGSNISSFYQREWQNKVTELGSASDISNDMWGVHQNYHNAINNTNVAMKTYLDVGNQDGQAYGVSPATDGGNVMNFLQARQNLTDGAQAFIGADKTDALLKNFDTDYAKSFVAGVAQSNPQKALQLLQMPEVQQHFSTQDQTDMIDVINRTQKAQKLAATMSLTANDGQLTGLVNDPNSTYYEKRAQIDQMDMQGTISPTAAAKARRVIKSSDDLDTQTDTPVMSGIVNQIYDLNANAATNGDDYLRGIRNIQNQILDKQGDGSLTSRDAIKLQNQVRTLSSAKLASATQSAGLEFYDANQKFNVLPPEYRGDATRQLFYAQDGANMTPQQLQASAMGIIDSINQQRRTATQASVKAATQGDGDMLKGFGATMDDVNETARLHHISPEEVLRQLRQNKLNQMDKSRPGAVKGVRSDEGSDDLPAAPARAGGADMREPTGSEQEGPDAGEGEE